MESITEQDTQAKTTKYQVTTQPQQQFMRTTIRLGLAANNTHIAQ